MFTDLSIAIIYDGPRDRLSIHCTEKGRYLTQSYDKIAYTNTLTAKVV